MYTELLTQAGLSEKEAAIYEKLLELGSTTVGKLLKHLPYKRGDLYNILASLKEKGLASERLAKGIMTFTVESPDKITDLLKAEDEKRDRIRKSVTSTLPDLKSLYNLAIHKPGVRFYEGKDGIINVYEQLLAHGQNIDSFEDKGEMARFIPEYSSAYPLRRVKRKIFNRVIAPSDNQINVSDPSLLRETRFLPTEKFPFRMDIKIAGHLMSLITFQKESPVGVLVDNSEIADNFRILFQAFWDLLGCPTPPATSLVVSQAPRLPSPSEA